jgi:hypothetical protein
MRRSPNADTLGAVLRVERHELGPRIYLLGLRIHEFALGFAILAVLLAFGGTDHWELTKRFDAVGAFGAWLVIKDWRDLFPSKRNTAAWSLLPHRVRR